MSSISGQVFFNEAFSQIWGCEKQCPFCGEFCRHEDNHVGKEHTCIQHRPEGFEGSHYRSTNIMDLNNCTMSIQKEFSSFNCSGHCQRKSLGGSCSIEGCEERHEYKDYKKYFPDWEIFPSADVFAHSSFWYYMMNKYEKDLAELYNIERPEIPESWKNITKTVAKESLKNLST